MKTSRKSANALLALAGWLIVFVTMILVKDGDVGQAITSLPLLIVTVLVIAAYFARNANR